MSPTQGAPDDQHLGRLSGMSYDPVFIMGDHRSGTTLFYQLLAQTGRFNVLTAHDVIRYDQLLTLREHGEDARSKEKLREEFAARGLTDRGLDNVAVSPDLPEEYGFLLGGSRPQISAKNRSRFEEICRKIQYLGSPDRPLLFKNPWDYLQFAEVHRAVPHARFLFIHRDPVHIVNSQLRALRDGFARRNAYLARLAPWYDALWKQPVRLRMLRALYSDRHRLALRITTRHVAKGARYYLEHIGQLNPGTHRFLRYEDLCREPDETLHRVLQFLGEPEDAAKAVTQQIQPRAGRLLPEVEKHSDWIRSRIPVYCAEFSY